MGKHPEDFQDRVREGHWDTKDGGPKVETVPGGAVRASSTGKGAYALIPPHAIRRLAGVYERGAALHAPRNWEKGIPFSRCLESALRHTFQYLGGARDEDHLAQAAWNLFALIHFEEEIAAGRLPESLMDLPSQKGAPK